MEKLARHADDEALLERVCQHQVLFGRLLQVRGMVPPSLFNQALIDFDPERESLGEHLMARGIITKDVLDHALEEQADEQREAYRLVEEAT
ncbi:bacteriophage N4 adsorption protein B [compost metagenome]